MIIFIDTSAWVKFFFDEIGTLNIQKFILERSQSEVNVFVASGITFAEMIATFRRAWKGHRIIQEEYDKILSEFKEQWLNFGLPKIDNELIKQSGNLAETYALKGCDAFQLASAVQLQANIFISCDEELNEAAEKCGFRIWNPVEGEFADILPLSENAVSNAE